MIVGVDAGTTCAIAVLDLQGRLVATQSRKNWSFELVLQAISAYSPSVIACDTNPAHNLSKQLNGTLGTKLFFPRKSLTQLEKGQMTKEFSTANQHERDALAAAICAYRHYSNKLRQTSKKLNLTSGGSLGNDSAQSSAARKLVIGGVRMNRAIDKVLE